MIYRTLWLSASATALCALASAPAHAQCVTTGPGTAEMPETGAVIECDSNLETDPILGPMANDVTVNVNGPAGGISVTGDGAVLLGDSATITIDAEGNRPIQTSGDSANAIEVGNDAAITVGGRTSTSGENSTAIRTGDNATVTANGTVTTGGGMSDAISVGSDSVVTVGARANVNTQNSNSAGVRLRGDNAELVVEAEMTEMNGLQQGLVTSSSGNSNPVLVEGDTGEVTVAGEVRSSSSDATAILVQGDDAVVTVQENGLVTAQSSGSDAIGVTGTGASISVEDGGEVRISSGNSAAIRSGAEGTVSVGGTVGISSSNSQGIVLGDAATLTVEAGGLVETSSSESQAVLVGEEATTATITVEEGGDIDAIGAQAIVDEGETDTTVTVNGVVFGGSSEPVIDLRAGNDVLIVNGTVRGSSADPVVDMGEGDDDVTINSSTTIEGPGVLVAGGGGDDSVTLASGDAFTSDQFTGVETTTVQGNTTSGDPKEGQRTSLEVNNESGDVTAGDGGDVTVGEGGSSTGATAQSGGSVTVAEGGRSDRVQSDAGGQVTVQNGGSGGLDATSAGGGTITFENGSTAEVQGEATTGPQSQTFAGADFQEGTRVGVSNSAVLRGVAAGDTVDIELPENAFAEFGAAAGAGEFGAALDAGAAAGDARALDLITTEAGDLSSAIEEGSGLSAGASTATGIAAALSFGELLTGRASLAPAGRDAPASFSFRAAPADGRVGWAAVYGGSVDGDRFDGDYGGLAAGVETSRPLGAGELTFGLAVAVASGDGGGRDFDAASIGLYGDYLSGPLLVTGALAFTDVDVEDGSVGDADVLSGRIELAYDLIGDYGDDRLVAPYGALSFASADIDGGTTSLGTIDGGDFDQGIAEIGLRVGQSFDTGGGRVGRVTAELGYERVFGDEDLTVSGTAFGTPFSTTAAALDEDRVKLGLGFESEVAPGATVGVRYEGRFGGGQDHRISLGARFTF